MALSPGYAHIGLAPSYGLLSDYLRKCQFPAAWGPALDVLLPPLF